jgi:exodeoxyribonuclease VII large subunit
LLDQTGKLGLRLGVAARRLLEALRRDLKSAERGLPRVEDLVSLPRQRLDHAGHRLDGALRSRVQRSHTRFFQVAGRLPSPRTLVAHHRQRMDATGPRLGRALSANTQAHHTRHVRIAARLRPAPIHMRIERGTERLDTLARRIERALAAGLAQRRHALDGQAKLLGSLGYHSVLARGFALVRNADGATVRTAAAVVMGQELDIEFADGRVRAEAKNSEIKSSEGKEAPQRPARSTPPSAPKRTAKDQGTLF